MAERANAIPKSFPERHLFMNLTSRRFPSLFPSLVLPLLLALVLGPLHAASEEELQAQVKATDMTSVDAVYALGEWCEANAKPTAARRYFGAVIQLDKNHELARAKMGQVLVGDRWVAANLVPGGKKTDAKGGDAQARPVGATRQASGPGPTAKEVKWDVTIEAIARENPFIEGQIQRMASNKNDSDAMDSAILTLYREDCRKEMIPLLYTALLRDDFRDLYGASMLLMKFVKAGDMATAKRLFGFIAKASERVTDKDDLESFAYVAPMMRDRRAIPRLIEMMDHPDQAVQFAAKKAFGQIALQPSDTMTAAKAKAWWDLNHNVSDRVWLNEQLQNSDPMIAVEAARGLYDLREKSLVPVTIKILKGDNYKANERALELIRRITGNDWGYDLAAKPDVRAKVVVQMEKWWKESGASFEWIEDRNAKPGATEAKANDALGGWVKQLASTTGNEAQLAEQNLLGKGNEAVPSLIKGLNDPGVIVRRKSNDILKSLSKTDVGFDPRADDRTKGVDAWVAWAANKGLIKVKEEQGEEVEKLKK
jgi:hypothetical protein